jgi:hypothetical protein
MNASPTQAVAVTARTSTTVATEICVCRFVRTDVKSADVIMLAASMVNTSFTFYLSRMRMS